MNDYDKGYERGQVDSAKELNGRHLVSKECLKGYLDAQSGLQRNKSDSVLANNIPYQEFLSKIEGVITNELVSERWCTGGLTGKNYSGEGESVPVTPDEQPELQQLDAILEIVCPTISFLAYKKLCSNVIATADCPTSSDYCGNHYNYKVKYFTTHTLYAYLKDSGLM